MQGLMQDRPLTLDHFFNRAETLFPKKHVVTATAGGIERATYGDWAERTRRLGGVLDDLGISADGRVATFAWNTARHLELYFAAPVQRAGAAHAQHPPVRRAAHLHRQPRRGRGDLRRPVAGRRCCGRCSTTFKTVRHVVVMDDGRGDVPDRRRLGRAARLRGPAGRGRAGRVAPRRREPGRVDVLHERHDRQPEGRRLLAPLDVAAHDRRDDRRQHRRLRGATRSCRSCRCSTPTPGAWPTPAWPSAPRSSCPGPTCRRRRSPSSSSRERVTVAAGVPDHLDGRAARARRAATRRACGPSRAAARPCRRRCRRPTASRSACPILQAWGMTETSPVASVGRIKQLPAPTR